MSDKEYGRAQLHSYSCPDCQRIFLAYQLHKKSADDFTRSMYHTLGRCWQSVCFRQFLISANTKAKDSSNAPSQKSDQGLGWFGRIAFDPQIVTLLGYTLILG